MADFVLMRTMLPAIPQSALNLQDVFLSAEASVLGEPNALNLRRVASSIVVMVDGLGFENLRDARQGFLQRSLAPNNFALCGFPSTTAASIASFSTGRSASEHGLFGYSIYDRSLNEVVNLLSGLDRFSILDYFKGSPISEHSRTKVHAVTLPDYENTGFTRATMHGAIHHFEAAIGDRFAAALRITEEHPGSLVYLYLPELDKEAHRFGVNSLQWHELFADVEHEISDLVDKCADDVGIILTADHGVIDVQSDNHIYLDEIDLLEGCLQGVSGDPRAPFVYLKQPDSARDLADLLNARFGEKAIVVTPRELVDAGYWTGAILEDIDVLPDLVVLALQDVAFFHRAFAKPSSMKVVGQHGSITERELKVPVLRFGAYSSSLLVP